jgi:hypothetical protein
MEKIPGRFPDDKDLVGWFHPCETDGGRQIQCCLDSGEDVEGLSEDS